MKEVAKVKTAQKVFPPPCGDLPRTGNAPLVWGRQSPAQTEGHISPYLRRLLKENPMAQVTFQRITCHETQEEFSDEPYLLYNGERLTREFSDVDEGETRTINAVRDLDGEAEVALFEADSWPDNDDAMARFTISESEAGLGQRVREIGSGGHGNPRYSLFYVVE
jgi:hypothetical protein